MERVSASLEPQSFIGDQGRHELVGAKFINGCCWHIHAEVCRQSSSGCEIRESSLSLSRGLRRFVYFENTIANAALCLDEFAAMPALSSRLIDDRKNHDAVGTKRESVCFFKTRPRQPFPERLFLFVSLFGQCCCQFRQFFLQLPCRCTERLRARA